MAGKRMTREDVKAILDYKKAHPKARYEEVAFHVGRSVTAVRQALKGAYRDIYDPEEERRIKEERRKAEAMREAAGCQTALDFTADDVTSLVRLLSEQIARCQRLAAYIEEVSERCER